MVDADWGALTAPSLGIGALPDSLAFTVHPLRGEGTATGGTVGGQKVVVRFAAGTLPANGWVRIWTQGLDTATGLRFRQDGGGGARADASGRAFVVTSLPDGTAAPTDPADPAAAPRLRRARRHRHRRALLPSSSDSTARPSSPARRRPSRRFPAPCRRA